MIYNLKYNPHVKFKSRCAKCKISILIAEPCFYGTYGDLPVQMCEQCVPVEVKANCELF